MGNEKSKKKYEAGISGEEKDMIRKKFKGDIITEQILKMTWNGTLSEELINTFTSYLFRSSKEISIEDLEVFFYNMTEGTAEVRAATLLDILSQSPTHLVTYVSDLLQSYIMILKKRCKESFQSWSSPIQTDAQQDIKRLAYFFTKDLKTEVEELERWLQECSFLKDLSETLYKIAFGIEPTALKPPLPKANKFSEVISVLVVLLLAHTCRSPSKEWRLLFSSSEEAHSWNVLQTKIIAQGPTLVLIQDMDGAVFGGFASQSWKLSPNFYGDENSFIFMLEPELRICQPTGYNNNFQYLNSGATTLPNGLGMGGQINYFGFFLSSEFGPASVSETCTTFRDYALLASKKEFKFSRVEFWAVGEADVKEEAGRQFQVTASGLVMERDTCATAILEMAGRTTYSKDLLPEPDAS